MAVNGLQAQVSRYADQQRLLLALMQKLATRCDASDLVATLVAGAQEASGAAGARWSLCREPGLPASYGLGTLAYVSPEADERLCDAVTGQGELVLSGEEAVLTLGGEGVPLDLAAVLAFPVKVAGATTSALWLGFGSIPVWDDAQGAFLRVLTAQASVVIARERERRQAHQTTEWLAAILNSAVDPAVVVDNARRVTLVNPAAQEALGISAGSLIGETLDSAEQTMDLAALLDDDHGLDELRLVEFAGQNGRTYAPSVADVRTTSSGVIGRVLWLRDITHFKKINANLSEFLSTVSHDMRTPLTFMKGYLDMMDMVGSLNERQTSFVEKIGSGVMQMSDMVEKILDAGRLDPETGSYELSREPTDIGEITEKAVAALFGAAEKKALSLHTTIHPDIPVMNIDKTMVSSAITNLIENAVKYTPEGGTIEVEAGVTNNALVFRVADNGYGISAEDQERLFRRNVRIRRKEWQRVKGSGLGLFIVKSVAQRHGGDAWVKSTEGQGSTFYLAIPLEGRNLLAGANRSG